MIKDQFTNINTASSGTVTYHLDANGNRVAGAVANYAPDRLWGAALTLIIIVMGLNLVARLVGRRSNISS
jgi:phosphate transport system permease protein